MREESTNAQGYFTVASLKPATYDVSVSAPGFSQSTQKGVTLLADQSATVNTTLSIGKAAETISVTGEVPHLRGAEPRPWCFPRPDEAISATITE